MQIAFKAPYLIFLGDEPEKSHAKTGVEIARWRRDCGLFVRVFTNRTDPYSRAHFDQWLTVPDNSLADTRKLQSSQFCQLKYLIYGIGFDGDK